SLRSLFAAQASTWPRDRPMRWLDVGTGAADIPLAIDAWAVAHGFDVECVALDRHQACLKVARNDVGAHPRITVVDGDALVLDRFNDASFDYVHAGMFLHHLTDDDVVRVLAGMARCAARQIIWNDLLRSPLSRVGIALLTIGAASVVRDDARLSVAKGFTPREIRALAKRAQLVDERLTLRRLVGRFVFTASAGRSRHGAPRP
ncbi:MAG: methyltransferase domain-containing protein, partial [Phycisphaerae bacterium]|nr:methyltransferase domain-containing protein [Phycisphaerae bacterium]